jgi:hypothetical protein
MPTRINTGPRNNDITCCSTRLIFEMEKMLILITTATDIKEIIYPNPNERTLIVKFCLLPGLLNIIEIAAILVVSGHGCKVDMRPNKRHPKADIKSSIIIII